MPTLYVISPRSSFTSLGDGDYGRGGRGVVYCADLAIVTVAALAPPHWTVTVVDESIDPIDFDVQADFIAITGKSSQMRRMVQVATHFRSRGMIVVMGGPLATLDPDLLRLHCDILFRGELEEAAPSFFADLERGDWRADYDGGRADIRLSPAPRWDLYPLEQAQAAPLQTTRGCPFDCEFCDVIAYQGRKQRHKTGDQVIQELDGLYAAGCRTIFLVDDNFTVHRRFAFEMLELFVDWNDRHADDPVMFITQASLDLARDDELVALCVRAGLRHIFVGIETNNLASLKETGKRQNLLLPINQAIDKLVGAGIAIRSGMIAGFDNDSPSIFQDLFAFAQSSPLPDFTVGALTASKGTRLYQRLEREGRLTEGLWDTTYDTNIIPAQMSQAALVRGVRWLSRRLNEPAAFQQRIFNFIAAYNGPPFPKRKTVPKQGVSPRYAIHVLSHLSRLGPAEAAMVQAVLSAAARTPAALRPVTEYLLLYHRARIFEEQVREKAEGELSLQSA
jgi:radical SAM superfamily enzyme YgiQ (UPF0313 family)